MSCSQYFTESEPQRYTPEIIPIVRGLVKRWLSIDTRLSMEATFEDVISRLPVWNNRALQCTDSSLSPFSVIYVGRSTQIPAVTGLIHVDEALWARPLAWNSANEPHTSLVCDYPLPGALVVPRHLRMLVPLNRPWGEITAHWKLAARRRRYAESCTTQRIEDEAIIRRINREMLEPFAKVRHGKEANNLSEHDVIRLAHSGHLGVLSKDGVPIAAHVGYSYERKGQRCWECLRFGYPESVYSDQHYLADVNTINAYWAIRYAMDTGHDVFDFGISPSSPDGGLLQFKHRRSGELSAFGCGIPFWLRLPKTDVDEFLWRWPLFSLEKEGIILNLGVPTRCSSEEVVSRLRPLAYRGLSTVRVRCQHDTEPLRANLRTVFESSHDHSRRKAPTLDIVTVSRQKH